MHNLRVSGQSYCLLPCSDATKGDLAELIWSSFRTQLRSQVLPRSQQSIKRERTGRTTLRQREENENEFCYAEREGRKQ